jgi:hypothetical protein
MQGFTNALAVPFGSLIWQVRSESDGCFWNSAEFSKTRIAPLIIETAIYKTARVITDTRCGSPRGLIQWDLTDGRRSFGYDDITTMSLQPLLCWQLQLNSRLKAAAQSFFPKYRDPISGSVFSGVDSHDPKICKTNDDLNLRSVTDVLNLFTRDLKIRMCCLWKYLWDLRILNKSGVLPMY